MRRLLSIAACLLCACASDPTVETAELRLAFALTDAPPVDADAAVFPLSTAQLHVASIDIFVPADTDCHGVPGLATEAAQPRSHTLFCATDGQRIRAQGPWAIDLTTGATTPALPAIAAPAGTIARVTVHLAPGDGAAGVVPSGSPLDDATVAVTGKAPAGTNATFYAMRLAFDVVATFESDGIPAASDATVSLVVRLDPARWLADRPLAACATAGDLPHPNGVLQITDGDGDCTDVEAPIIEALKASGTLDPGD
jgi:hypothetical protein